MFETISDEEDEGALKRKTIKNDDMSISAVSFNRYLHQFRVVIDISEKIFYR